MTELTDELKAAFIAAAGWQAEPWRFNAEVADGLTAVLAAERSSRGAAADPLPFGTATVDPCTGCGHPENWHRKGRCAGDLMHCPCETWMPLDLEGRF